jgi:DNA replication initiation complex subunit (GINS family)
MKPFVREILQAARIADLKAAVGVPPPSLDGLTPEERCLVERFEAAPQAEYDAMLDQLRADAAKLRAEMQATRATLSTAPPKPRAMMGRR